MSITTQGLTQTQLKFKKLKDQVIHKQILDEIGNFVIFNIQDRTADGKDVDGQPFTPYSKSYKMIREEKGLPSGKVDLFFTGSMMSAMTYVVKPNSVKIFFQSTQDKKGSSNVDKAYYLNENRKFFSISYDQKIQIVNLYNKYIESII